MVTSAVLLEKGSPRTIIQKNKNNNEHSRDTRLLSVITKHRESNAMWRKFAGFPYGRNIYLYVWLKAPIPSISVKLLPERGKELRERYNAISPAYHICEKHWNDIFIEETFPNDMIEEWIKESYDLVKTELPDLAFSRI